MNIVDSSQSAFVTPESEQSALNLFPDMIERMQHLSDTLMLAVQLPSADPNFLLVCARTPHELVLKEKGSAGECVRSRQEALIRYQGRAHPGTPMQRLLERSGSRGRAHIRGCAYFADLITIVPQN